MNLNKPLFLAIAALVSSTVWAQQRLTLEQCIAMAQENSYAMRLADAEVGRAETLRGTAWEMDRTSVTLSQDPTSGGSPDNSLTLSQTFDFPTVYTARRRTLKAGVEVARSQRNLSRKQLTADITTAYNNMVYAMERKRILTSQDSILRDYLRVATIRYEAGEARQLERLTASRMLSENAMEIENVDAEYAALCHTMRQLLNTDADIQPATSELTPVAYDAAAELNYDASSEGDYWQKQVERADKAVSEAKSGYLPNLSLGLRTQLVLKGWNPYGVERNLFEKGNFMGFEVGLGLPLFFGSTRAKVKAARQERDIATLAAMQQRQRRQSEFDIQKASLLAAKKRMDYYRTNGLAEAGEMKRIAKVSYENGDITYVEYTQSLLDAVATQLKYAEAINSYNQAATALQNIQR